MNCSVNTIETIYKKEKKNIQKLAQKLKKLHKNAIDELVHQHHKELFQEFNCLSCARCCKELGPRITNKDIERIATQLGLKQGELVKNYLKIDEDGDFVFKSMPCPFLLGDNTCKIYHFRPKACEEYPHTNRRNFIEIIDVSTKNCATCPIVLEIFMHIKEKV